MTIKELHDLIETNNSPTSLIIFKNSDSSFIAHQYIHEIAKQRLMKVKIVDTVEDIVIDHGLFDYSQDSFLQVYITDKFDIISDAFKCAQNIIFVCNDITKKSSDVYGEYIVDVPKLTKDNVKEYLYSNLTGLSSNNIKFLSELFGSNVYIAEQEIGKIAVFPEAHRDIIFKELTDSGAYDCYKRSKVFDLVKSILVKDMDSISILYQTIDKKELNIFLISKLLYSNLKTIISVVCDKTSTYDTCHIKPGAYWYIKNTYGSIDKEELIRIFLLVTDINTKVTSGEVPSDMAFDYLLFRLLGNTYQKT